MARPKRTPSTLEKAVRCAAGMDSIDPSLDLGNERRWVAVAFLPDDGLRMGDRPLQQQPTYNSTTTGV